MNAKPSIRRVASRYLGERSIQTRSPFGGNHTGQGFALLQGPAVRHDELPPLERTEDFAAFVSVLLD